MYTIIIFMFIGSVISIICIRKQLSDFIDTFLMSILGCLCGFLAGLLTSIMLGFFGLSKFETTIKTYEIETLQDNSVTKGRFFIGSGRVDGSFKYTFYYFFQGGYKLKELDHDRVIIKYNKTNPKVVEYDRHLTDDLVNDFVMSHDNETKSYVIYVPKGTIRQDYNLDSK